MSLERAKRKSWSGLVSSYDPDYPAFDTIFCIFYVVSMLSITQV